MAEEKEGNIKDPTPLSLEGDTTQLKISTDPKPADDETTLKRRGKDFIKGIIATPKETGSEEGSDTKPSTSGSSVPPKEPVANIITRLGDEGGNSGGGGNSIPPNPEESKDGAGMLIDGFNALFLFFVSIWSKNNEPKDYEVDTEEKTRLKKYLSAIMQRSGKSINPIWLFIGLFILTYIPLLRKGYQHRQMVGEEREKNKPGVTIIGEPRRKRRRKSGGNNDDAIFYPSEEIR